MCVGVRVLAWSSTYVEGVRLHVTKQGQVQVKHRGGGVCVWYWILQVDVNVGALQSRLLCYHICTKCISIGDRCMGTIIGTF